MWTTAIRMLSFNGNVKLTPGGGGIPQALPGVSVDVYRFVQNVFGDFDYKRINTLPAITDGSGDFTFSNIPVEVSVQTVTSGVPPYGTVEIVQPNSLPNLGLYISSQDLGSSTSIEVFDERTVIDESWVTAHSERLHVSLSGSPLIELVVPDLVPSSSSVPNGQFHFLRVGRATRDDIGEIEIGATRAGYMNSAPGAFFPGIVDAPFGGTLHIGGHFGPDIAAFGDELYYTISRWEYTGDFTSALAPADLTNEVQILDPLVNKKFNLPTSPGDSGSWEVLPLGPFSGTVTATATPVQVYKRPPVYNPATEYYPFYDLMVKWDSTDAPNSLIVLSIKTYRRTNADPINPDLVEISLFTPPPGVVDHKFLPLMIDNRPPVPVFHPFNPADPQERKFHTAFAHFIGVPESITGVTPMGVCNQMTVIPGHTNGNECILTRYSVTDGASTTNPHPHLLSYSLWAEYTPKTIPGSLDSQHVSLKHDFVGHEDISNSYNAALPSAPEMEVDNFTSVIVPAQPDKWPPEPQGDVSPQCPQYAMEVSLRCAVRTVDGWGRRFGHRHVSRHLIIRES